MTPHELATLTGIVIGSLVLAVLVYRVQAAIVSGLISRAYKRGYDAAAQECIDAINERDREIIKLKTALPSIGGSAWCIDFNERTMHMAKVIKTPTCTESGYAFIRDHDMFPLTGIAETITVLMPDSAQEC